MKSPYTDSLAHTTWECKYHIVFAPKFRRKEIYGTLKREILYRQSDYNELIKEAKENIDKGNENKLLSNLVEDYMYMSSRNIL